MIQFGKFSLHTGLLEADVLIDEAGDAGQFTAAMKGLEITADAAPVPGMSDVAGFIDKRRADALE